MNLAGGVLTPIAPAVAFDELCILSARCRRHARRKYRTFCFSFKFGWLSLRVPLSAARQLYIHRRAANKITSQSWSLVLTAATAKLGILDFKI